jgi:hypothetical protein
VSEPLMEALMQVATNAATAIEAAAGHRQAALDAGFGSEVAEQMAAEFHRHILRVMFQGKS